MTATANQPDSAALAAPDESVVLRVVNLSKSFDGVEALRGVFLDVRRGEIHAVLGHNGAGKSVLMKTLMGVHRPDEGVYEIAGEPARFGSPSEAQSRGLSMVYQEFGLVPELPVYENVLLHGLPGRHGLLDRREAIRGSMMVLSRLGSDVSPTEIVENLKVADQQEVEIARAIALDPHVLIMDEPTAALSHGETQRLFDVVNKLRDDGVAIVYITHKLDEVDELADRVTVLRDGEVQGTFVAGEFNAALLMEKITGRKLATVAREIDHTEEPGPEILVLRELSVGDAVSKVSLDVRAGEVVGVTGLVGAGKTELAKAIVGAAGEAELSGECRYEGRTIDLRRMNPSRARRMGIGLVPEDRKAEGIVAEQSAMENALLPALGRFRRTGGALIDWPAARRAVDGLIAGIGIKPTDPLRSIEVLSGGNQQKVVIGKWLLTGELKLLILDEPTRGVDVGARADIYTVIRDLAKEGLAVLLLSSDIEEILIASDNVLAMRRGRIVAEASVGEVSEADLLAAVAGGAA